MTSKNTNTMFEYATRHKLRFATSRNQITVEDLWDVPLRSRDGFDLNDVAKRAATALKAISEENYVEAEKSNPMAARLEAALDVVKFVIQTKLDEEEAAKNRAAARSERARLLELKAKKQDERLAALSDKEIDKRLAALDAEM